MTKTWLDAHHGWDPSGNVIETYWIDDPAIDQEKSDAEAYFDTLDAGALVIKSGEKPERMIVRMPTPEQWADITSHILPTDLDAPTDPQTMVRTMMRASVVAFELCVRFPDVESARPVSVAGMKRLPQSLLRFLQTKHPEMISAIGSWVIGRSILQEEEKKHRRRHLERRPPRPNLRLRNVHAAAQEAPGVPEPRHAATDRRRVDPRRFGRNRRASTPI